MVRQEQVRPALATHEVREVSLLSGDKLYLQRARATLPLLVRQARAEQPISYGQLAEELGIPNPRNLNYVLGAIGRALVSLSQEWGEEVPPIQALVRNQATGLPGEGISWFAPDAREFRNASPRNRRQVVDGMLAKVYRYRRWDDVLRQFGLVPVSSCALAASAQQLWSRHPSEPGETPDHERFKRFIAQNPSILGLSQSLAPGEVEFVFASGDVIDVLFRTGSGWIGVEVKSAKSDVADIERGLFQCVKYQALIEVTQRVQQVLLSSRVILALEGSLPPELVAQRNVLGIDLRDSIVVPRTSSSG